MGHLACLNRLLLPWPQVCDAHAADGKPCSLPSPHLPLLLPVPAAPGPPRDVGVSVGYREAYLTWRPPLDDGGADVLKYILIPQRVDGEFGGPPVHVTAPAVSGTITGLAGGERYRFLVRAVNEAGIGPASAPTSDVQLMCTWSSVKQLA